jgi:hypothetical protein
VLNDHLIRACALFHSVHGSAPPAGTTQKSLYVTLNTDKAHLAALTTKLEAKYDWEKRLHPESALFLARAIHHNVGLMPRYLPACIHTHKFNLVQHAVATRYRERWRRNIDPAFRLNCPFCDADLETLEHLHTMCTVSRSAATIILSRQLDKTNFLILKDAEADDFTFRNTSRSIPQTQLIILIVFSLAIWNTRAQYTMSAFSPSTLLTAPFQIAARFSTLYEQARLKKTRKSRDKAAAKADFLKRLSLLPQAATRLLTDGSSSKTGAAGAGYTYRLSPCHDRRYCSIALGRCSNNVAEITAADQAFVEISHAFRDEKLQLPVYCFIDSKYTINADNQSSSQQDIDRQNACLTSRPSSPDHCPSDVGTSTRWHNPK